MKRAKLNPRKLLIASVGIATIDYVAACDSVVLVANLMAPPYETNVGGNGDAGPDASPDAGGEPEH